MLRIESNGNIYLTRGDSGRIAVSVTNDATGGEYTLAEGDKLVLTVKRRSTDATAIITKKADGSGLFTFRPEDTQGLNFADYRYDVQLTTETGDVYTIVPPAAFTIGEEVSW